MITYLIRNLWVVTYKAGIALQIVTIKVHQTLQHTEIYSTNIIYWQEQEHSLLFDVGQVDILITRPTVWTSGF